MNGIAASPGILICPERDAMCPHGWGCPFTDGSRCDIEASRSHVNQTSKTEHDGDDMLTEQVKAAHERLFNDPYRQQAIAWRKLADTIEQLVEEGDGISWNQYERATLLDCANWFRELATEWEIRAADKSGEKQ